MKAQGFTPRPWIAKVDMGGCRELQHGSTSTVERHEVGHILSPRAEEMRGHQCVCVWLSRQQLWASFLVVRLHASGCMAAPTCLLTPTTLPTCTCTHRCVPGLCMRVPAPVWGSDGHTCPPPQLLGDAAPALA